MNATSPQPARVIVVGSLNEDTILTVDTMPSPGQTISATSRVRRFGGKGANQAVAAARFGAETLLIGCVGRDNAGDEALANLRDNGVDTAAVTRTASASGAATVLVDEEGENEIVVFAGANADLDADTVTQALDTLTLGERDVVAVGYEVTDEAVLATVAAAAKARAQLVLNPSPVRALPPALRNSERTTIVVNATEAVHLGEHANPRTAAASLAARFNATVVLTLGPEGALLFVDAAESPIPPVRVNAVDTVGAGDTLLGTYCAQRAADTAPEAALRIASAAAALAVTAPGAQDGMPRLDDVLDLLPRLNDPAQPASTR